MTDTIIEFNDTNLILAERISGIRPDDNLPTEVQPDIDPSWSIKVAYRIGGCEYMEYRNAEDRDIAFARVKAEWLAYIKTKDKIGDMLANDLQESTSR